MVDFYAYGEDFAALSAVIREYSKEGKYSCSKRNQKEVLCEMYLTSGLDVQYFCQVNAIKVRNLKNWLKKLKNINVTSFYIFYILS